MSELVNKLDIVVMEVKDVQGAQQVYSKMLEAQSQQLVRRLYLIVCFFINIIVCTLLKIVETRKRWWKRNHETFWNCEGWPRSQVNKNQTSKSVNWFELNCFLSSIAQLQQLIMESQSKINQERKEREADVHILNQRFEIEFTCVSNHL